MVTKSLNEIRDNLLKIIYHRLKSLDESRYDDIEEFISDMFFELDEISNNELMEFVVKLENKQRGVKWNNV